jgi:hypothetical protein
MWSHYAQLHEGVVLELACIPELDSVWGSATPVSYSHIMPPAFEDESLIRLASGQGHTSPEKLLDKFVTAKALDWAYEREWRVVLHFTDPSQQTQDIPFWRKVWPQSTSDVECRRTIEMKSEPRCDKTTLPRKSLWQKRWTDTLP